MHFITLIAVFLAVQNEPEQDVPNVEITTYEYEFEFFIDDDGELRLQYSLEELIERGILVPRGDGIADD